MDIPNTPKRAIIHIGLESCITHQFHKVIREKRKRLLSLGVIYPLLFGGMSHTGLFLALRDPKYNNPLSVLRDRDTEDQRNLLLKKATQQLQRAFAETPDAHTLILSCEHFGTGYMGLTGKQALKNLLSPFCSDIQIVAHVDHQSRVLTRLYPEQLLWGRLNSLDHELDMCGTSDWYHDSLAGWPAPSPQYWKSGQIQNVPFWLDYEAVEREWESVFGANTFHFLDGCMETLNENKILRQLRSICGLEKSLGKLSEYTPYSGPRPLALARLRAFNHELERLSDHGFNPSPTLRKRMADELYIDEPKLEAGALKPISNHFNESNKQLRKRHEALRGKVLKSPKKEDKWRESPLEYGFRATQYATALLPMIKSEAREMAKAAKHKQAEIDNRKPVDLSQNGARLLSEEARTVLAGLASSPMMPHNEGAASDMPIVKGAPFSEYAPKSGQGTGRRAIVACMKNEGPYILEWVAYHRAIGFDDILVYTNGCEDGTTEILDRLQELNLVHHCDNNNWTGNSPQNFALNASLSHPVVQNAAWIAHIDVDEFINIKVGNGTLDDFFEKHPQATHIAMTWRLFGNNDISEFSDRPIIEQFTRCAPWYCPKPHMNWGFKSLFRNDQSYATISCHRPNKLDENKVEQVKWINGGGKDITAHLLTKGWRSSQSTIGYDDIQLNHYALRSRKSYMVKRQRGRALHVGRQIGLNYWIRMDWNYHEERSIQRNLPRLEKTMTQIRTDDVLIDLIEKSWGWHRAKAQDLYQSAAGKGLWDEINNCTLTLEERVACTLTQGVET